MNRILNTYFKTDYLFEVVSGSKYQRYYLYLSVAIIVFIIILKILAKVKKRSEAYRKFDRIWFWGFITLGFIGLFVWFSRDQGLPIFGTRFVSYLWILSILLFKVFLYWYYKKKTKKDLVSHYNQKRKEKYLSK